MDIEQLDYRSLVVFESISRHLNAGLAANELGMSNSTISRHLANLREVFQDVLFIRRAHGFVPTDKASQILPLVTQLLADYDNLRKRHTQFDPASAKEHFTIYAFNEFTYATNRIVNDLILPQAPSLSFEVRTLSMDCRREIENGDIDFAVVYENLVSDRLVCDLFSPTEEMYLVAKADHQIFQREITLERLYRYPYFELDNFGDVCCPLLASVAQQQQQTLEVAGYIDNLAALCRHLQDSNATSMSCNVFSKEFLGMVNNIRTERLPDEITKTLLAEINVGRPVGNYLVYSQINQSACHTWVKQQLFNGLKDAWYKALQA
ncbi:LysR family transcriptional regulator [uncultured Ferrimonas sp.]|uniref:LysR family transcriptional regulator n=1 Tax=uncultured Ferrimonas sp. TaxID=432640 RepID=UPI002603F3F6|nr:LysR family transcriptional regulator [uncultured Ferrimonas sp.]